MASQPTYYLEINGKPSCVSDHHPRSSPPWACSQGVDLTHATEERGYVLRDHPDATVVIREGFCPAYRQAEEDDRERREWEEERVRASLEDSYEE